jgi:hypothetical protein
MNVPEEIQAALRGRYGELIHRIFAKDLGGHTFSVVWSDDGGRTLLPTELTRRAWQQELIGLAPSRVRELLLEKRMSGNGAGSEA